MEKNDKLKQQVDNATTENSNSEMPNSNSMASQTSSTTTNTAPKTSPQGAGEAIKPIEVKEKNPKKQ